MTKLGPSLLLLALLAVGLAPTRAVAGAPGAPTEAGLRLLERKDCLSCHTVDGRAGEGPTLLGLAGSPRRVTVRGAADETTVSADAAYLRRAIAEPDVEIVAGYAAGDMPREAHSEDELAAMVATLEQLGAPDAVHERRRAEGSLIPLAAAVALFVLGHLLLSFGPIRAALVGALGAKGFQAAYSLVALGGFVWMVIAYPDAPYVELWRPPAWAAWFALIVTPFAFVFVVAGMTTPTPTALGREGLLEAHRRPRGIVKVTRHPGLWGLGLWGVAHLPANGDAASVLLFGSFAALSGLGMAHLEARRRRAYGADWERFAAATSVLPFAAILAGRARVSLREIGWLKLLIAALLFGGMLHGHLAAFGASPLPWSAP